MLEIIRRMINARKDKPCQVIPAFSNKKQPPKPFASMQLINHLAPDVYSNSEETRNSENVYETMLYTGNFLVQFDVLGNTDAQAFKTANLLKELISYDMRYSEWIPNGIGIANGDFKIKAMHELTDSNEWLYRYSFDVEFESFMTMDRVTELAKRIELEVNSDIIIDTTLTQETKKRAEFIINKKQLKQEIKYKPKTIIKKIIGGNNE